MLEKSRYKVEKLILQLELTNRCNLSCSYCLRNSCNIKPQDFPVRLFERVISEAEPSKLILYGWGEPLLHEDFLQFLKIAKRYRVETATNTNATLLTPKLMKKLSSMLTSICISIHGNNLEKISQAIKQGLNVSASLIITKDNASSISKTVESLCEVGVEEINLSHPIPFSKEVFKRCLFITQSREAFEISKPYLDRGWEFIHSAVVQSLIEIYQGKQIGDTWEEYKRLREKALEQGCSINLPALLNYRERLKDILKLEKQFEEIKRLAFEYGVSLHIPEIFANSRRRGCEYIEKEISFVKANGEVAPCMLYAYEHGEYLNFHPKRVERVSYGNVREKSLAEIWKNEEYVKFREIRKNFDNIPWCGECVYSTLDCWYVNSNEVDCYGNSPTCNECLFSVGISKCVL